MSEEFGLYIVRNLHTNVRNIERVTVSDMTNLYSRYCHDNGIVHMDFATTHKLYAFVKKSLTYLCDKSNVDINQVMRNNIWTEDGKTTSGKSYNFRNMSVTHNNNNDPISGITDLMAYENQQWLRDEMQQCIESIVTTSPDEFIKLTKRLR
ncbi:hypothetical protein EPVG_00444 [Emiliania huxleyi virus 201]|nr:hypothetical protein ELVG_00428 [Emiliania huxleyi virus 203]AEP15796.1 hypothetical protein EQVG_00387 [Emiliania huxleyi virus 207]AEP16201.1 hypothetical protein ERVG_00326 [Emiliania huxleyi virus 208]AET98331.1 hypothetical protein EPVG_00444 [Emiliania huxleyi virus 201]